MSPAAFSTGSRGYGLSPSLSLFNSPFDETVDMSEEVERAGGSPRPRSRSGSTGRWSRRSGVPARMDRTGSRRRLRRGRLDLAIENCGSICQVLQAEGLRPLHHSHVGGVFETEGEITALLDDLGPT